MFTISDWLALHDLQASALRNVLTAHYMGELKDHLLEAEELPATKTAAARLRSQEECFKTYVVPALAAGFPENSGVAKILQCSEFKSLTEGQVYRPQTVDRGSVLPPVIVMDWRTRPEDLMCLAHEAAHTLQIILSGHDTMPPIARETCAFIAELLLLRFVQKNDPALHLALEQVWAEENAAYLLGNLDSLADGLLNLNTPYHYYMNYPLARLSAVRLFASDSISLIDLFSSGVSAMKHLPIEEMAAQAAKLNYYFPKLPEPNKNTSKLDFYRDIEANNNQERSKLQGYYTTLQAHLFAETVLIWLSENQRPMGCATWARRYIDNTSEVTQLTTPFGGHVRLQRLLDKKRKPANSNDLHGRGEPA
ncbi:hypothetical protein [uncultured Ruegeria sp.]|uniref:hypothetical protein n=1 Tax=uncultured Ruegeria sp. TaxID=259304 RepID=UPI002624C436|nr:hypothetical protein [uncultured Ruegeria sp.]